MCPQRLLPIVAMVGLGLMYFHRISFNVVDPDIWHEMALAREIVASGTVPLEDHFAYTPTVFPVVHHEWGAGLVAYGIAMATGPTGILLVKYMLAFGVALVCWICAHRRKASFEVLSFLGAIGVVLLENGFSPIRAQAYSFLFTGCLLYCLDRDHEGAGKWLLYWPVVFICWLNLHGGCLVGAGLLALTWLERFVRKEPHVHLFLLGLAMIPLMAVNPYGTYYYGYLWRAVGMARPLISEWQPVWQSGSSAQIGMLGLSLLIVAYVARNLGVTRLRGWPVLLATAFLACRSSRFLPIYGVAWMCYVPGYVQSTALGDSILRVYSKLTRPMLATWTACAILMTNMAVRSFPWQLQIPAEPQQNFTTLVAYPVGALKYLADLRFRGNLMVPFDCGGYVSWKLYPDVKVSIDSRYEVAYPPESAEENYRFYAGQEGWEQVLTSYATDAVLIPRYLPVSRLMPDLLPWQKIYTDRTFDIYVRSTLPQSVVDWSQKPVPGEFP